MTRPNPTYFAYNDNHYSKLSSETKEYIRGIATDIVKEKLLHRGCIEANDVSPADPYGVHPVFYNQNFPNLGEDEYERMHPALKLASRFIKEDAALGWWAHLHQGQLKVRNGNLYLAKGQYGDFPERANLETKVALLRFATSVQFIPLKPSDGHTIRSSALGITCSSKKEFELYLREDCGMTDSEVQSHMGYVRREEDPVIGLHPNWRRSLAVDKASRSPSQEVQVQFLLATTLLHELAHAFFQFIHGVRSKEPFHRLDVPYPECELGYSWEKSVLGVSPWPWDLRRDTDAIRSLTNVTVLYSAYTAERGIDQNPRYGEDCKRSKSKGPSHNCTILPIQWINSWFLDSTWKRIQYSGLVNGRSQLDQAPVLVSAVRCGFRVWNIDDCRYQDYPAMKE